MLQDFLMANREELISSCRLRVSTRRAPRPTESELEHGIPLFLQQLIDMLQDQQSSSSHFMLFTATQHGEELLQQGFTVAQVIHDYGDLCQAITELAAERMTPISPTEFGVLNRCLDDAIAAAVTEHARQRERRIEAQGAFDTDVRLGILAHELRNLLGTAMLSFEVIKRGSVAINGTTSGLHERALSGLRSLVERTLAEVRLSVGVRTEDIELVGFIEDVGLAASLEADVLAIRLSIPRVESGLHICADRQILSGVLANLLQNAFKFTRENNRSEVSLKVHHAAGRVFIDVEDSCGGLPAGEPDGLLRPFEQRSRDRSGLGLGLTICQRGVEACAGALHVRNLPGKGCVFTIEVARAKAAVP